MDAKEDIKRRLSVEDVVSSYIELKRAGRNFKALSPFTNEKTASFMISPDKQIWHDFSANRGGDIFTFVMEMEGVDFRGAMEILARKAGLDLSNYQRGDGKTAELKKRLYEALDQATRYYHLTLSKNSVALDYLKTQRGYSADTIRAFKLGFAPSQGSALMKFLAKQKFTPEEMKRAGLTAQRRGGAGDMFRGRIMIPLTDGQGRVVGFTARQLRDDPDGPKYINTPQTLLYDKSRHVYGLHLAKQRIRQDDFAAVVEGNLDVIASWQAGVTNTVATAGTALTRDHLLQLSRLTRNIKLAFDQDRAGLVATVRAVPIAGELELNLSIVSLSGAKDPDELIKQDPAKWSRALERSVYVLDWLIEHMATLHDLSTAPGKRSYSDALVEIIRRLGDPVELDHYVGVVADKLGVGRDSIARKVETARAKPEKTRNRLPTQTQDSNAQSPKFTFIDTFLGLLLLYPETRPALTKLDSTVLLVPEQQTLLEALRQNPKLTEADLQQLENYVKIIMFRAEEFYGGSTSSARLADAMQTARRIASETKKQQTTELAARLRDAADTADHSSFESLLKQTHQRLKED